MLDDPVRATCERCAECGACVQECAFLQAQGTPKAIASSPDGAERVFGCSLCGLCASVCPLGLDPAEAFLSLRRQGAAAGDRAGHRRLLAYERRGTSPRYTWRALPEGCDTVFFPGCALPGTRPEVTLAAFERLRQAVPRLGLVLDCCTKPSHDLGRAASFDAQFGELRGWLLHHGVRRVLVACPNCHKVFRAHGDPLTVGTVYEVLAGKGGGVGIGGGEAVVVHDPCSVRGEERLHEAVRELATGAGLRVEEMEHARSNTLCCGEGGAVSHLEPSLAAAWTRRRTREAAGRRIVTYCAGCASYLGRAAATTHLLDEVFARRRRPARAPLTYWNRLRLKRRVRREFPAAVTGQRPPPQGRGLWGRPARLGLLALLVAAVAALRVSGVSDRLDERALREWIGGYGAWGPAVYVALYTVAPALFLPGLPFTLAAGVLFGPLWGTAYALVGSTLGACLAFAVARYGARGWLEAKLTAPRWRSLDEQVGRQGWKVVALTRLIPVFPFVLLNYAFGLTRIRFGPYALATFFGMAPACAAFVVFSSSVIDLLKGKASPRLAVGALLLAAVSAVPLAWRRIAARRQAAGEGR